MTEVRSFPHAIELRDPVWITMPDGATRTLNVDTNRNEIVFGDTFRQGIYKLTAGTNAVKFAVNLLDSSESNTEPKSELRFGKYSASAIAPVRRANMELWRWIALAGLAVLMFEWWYYHKRTV